jgi:hypothetical protein
MRESHSSRSLLKRLLLVVASLIGIVLVCVFASWLSVQQMFRGIASSRATGLAAYGIFPSFQQSQNAAISRSAELQSRTTTFEDNSKQLYLLVAKHRGEFEDLRTENHSGQGRALAASFTVPANEFDDTLGEIKMLGRVQTISVASEDAAIKTARMNRQVEAAKNNLTRLRSLQREHKAGIQDALALQKELAKATDDLAQVENEHQNLLSTVARASVHFALLEEYKATLDVDISGAVFQLQNSLIEGIGSVVSSFAAFFAALFEFGLPIGFWAAVSYLPIRFAWKKIQRFRVQQRAVVQAE